VNLVTDTPCASLRSDSLHDAFITDEYCESTGSIYVCYPLHLGRIFLSISIPYALATAPCSLSDSSPRCYQSNKLVAAWIKCDHVGRLWPSIDLTHSLSCHMYIKIQKKTCTKDSVHVEFIYLFIIYFCNACTYLVYVHIYKIAKVFLNSFC